MAVTISVGELAAAMRLTEDINVSLVEPELGMVTRMLEVGTALVTEIAPLAPDAIANEAIVRMASYLWDAPTAAPGQQYSAAWRNSGAASLVSRWVTRRALKVTNGVISTQP